MELIGLPAPPLVAHGSAHNLYPTEIYRQEWTERKVKVNSWLEASDGHGYHDFVVFTTPPLSSSLSVDFLLLQCILGSQSHKADPLIHH